jgi:hypothetical protein
MSPVYAGQRRPGRRSALSRHRSISPRRQYAACPRPPDRYGLGKSARLWASWRTREAPTPSNTPASRAETRFGVTGRRSGTVAGYRIRQGCSRG